jgi:hypothetical protein
MDFVVHSFLPQNFMMPSDITRSYHEAAMGQILVRNIEDNDIQDRSSFWLRDATAMIDFVRPNTRSFEDLGVRELIGIRRIAREVGLGVGTVLRIVSRREA